MPAGRAVSGNYPTIGLYVADSHPYTMPDANTVKIESGPGDDVMVDVRIIGVIDLAAYDFTVRYSGGFMSANATLDGTTFDPIAGPFAGAVDVFLFSVGADFIRIALSLRGFLSFSGNGTLLRMHYHVNDFGVGSITLPATSMTLVDSFIDAITPGLIIGTFVVDAGSLVDVALVKQGCQTTFGHVLKVSLEGTLAGFSCIVRNIGANNATVFARFDLRTGDRALRTVSPVVTIAPGVEIELFGSVNLENLRLRYSVTGSAWMSSNGLFFVQSPHGVDTLTFNVQPS